MCVLVHILFYITIQTNIDIFNAEYSETRDISKGTHRA